MGGCMICVPCQKFYRPKKNGVFVEELMPSPTSEGFPYAVVDGKSFWVSYKLWTADLLECPGCYHQVIGGFPIAPIAEHFQPDYKEIRARYAPTFFIPDCGPRHIS